MKLLDFWSENRGRFRAALLDVDGTLVCGPHPLPGGAEFVNELRREGVPFYFLTNDDDHTHAEKAGFLRRGGVEAAPDEVVSCLDALPLAFRENGWNGQKFLKIGHFGTIPPGDYQFETDGARIGECAGILLSEGEYDWRTGWEAAINFLRFHPATPFVVPNPDAYWPSATQADTIGIGSGGQARCIRLLLRLMGVRVKPYFLGKPYSPLYRTILEMLARRCGGIAPEPESIFCLGDSLASDIRGANRAGMSSALVLTGITTAAMAARAAGEFRPRYVFESIR